jgi:hypothetical protein
MTLLNLVCQSLSHLLVHAIFSTKDRRAVPAFRGDSQGDLCLHGWHLKELGLLFSYQEEIREIFKRHRVAFDERYVCNETPMGRTPFQGASLDGTLPRAKAP